MKLVIDNEEGVDEPDGDIGDNCGSYFRWYSVSSLQSSGRGGKLSMVIRLRDLFMIEKDRCLCASVCMRKPNLQADDETSSILTLNNGFKIEANA